METGTTQPRGTGRRGHAAEHRVGSISELRSTTTMRKIFVAFMVLLALSFVACGGGDSSPTAPTPTPTPTPTPEPAPAPDLVVGSPTVNDSSPAVGATFTLSTTVRNDGAGDAPATTLRAYRSTDATITTADTAEGTAAMEGLAAAGSTSTSVQLTAPATAGTYYYGACVDAVTDESDTTNNCSAAVQVTVPAPTPTPPPTNTGRRYEVGDVITTMPTGFWVPDLTRGASFSVIGGNVEINFNNGGLIEKGGYRYTCENTGGCAVSNREVRTGTIVETSTATPPAATTAPDLEVGSPSVSDNSPETGGSFTLSATVQNDGDGAAAATTLRYYRSTDGTITTSDTLVGTDAVAGLAAGATSSESISLTAPSTAGTYYYGACVDAVADESDITDNCSTSVQVTVPAPTPPPTPTPPMSSACVVGQELSPGQSCDIPGGATFSVRSDGFGCYNGSICAGASLNINDFSASKISGTSRWRIDALPVQQTPPTPTSTPPSGPAVEGTISTCEGTQLVPGSSVIEVTIAGTVHALRSLSLVRVEGTANGSHVGIDLLGDIEAGSTESFRIQGYPSLSGSTLRCEVKVTYRTSGSSVVSSVSFD